jgi:hypothetical protein
MTTDNGAPYGGKIMSKSQGLLIIFMSAAVALFLMLGSVFAAPNGTVILDPPTATKSSLPGTTVTYTLWFTNSGGTTGFTDTFTLDHEGNQWPVDLSRAEILLPGNASTDIVVSVTIPFTPTTTHDTVTITVSSQGGLLLPVSRLTTSFYQTYLPIISKPEDVCRPTGESYEFMQITPETSSAETHPDINLAVRGYTPTLAFLGLVDLGDTSNDGPQLAGLFSIPHLPSFTDLYQVYDWDWTNKRRGAPIDDPAVSLADLAAVPGEPIRVPDRMGPGTFIGGNYKVLVLYASPDRLTLKYTSEDDMVAGYGLHLENVCVDANLLALYQQLNSAGRHQLPALRAGQAIGRARSDHIGVAVRDTGAFMDPRSHYDWWRDY